MNVFGRGENKQKKEKSRASVMTRETIGMTLLLFSIAILFITVTGKYVFGEIGTAITAFFLGIFGFLAYPLLVLGIYCSVLLIAGKKGIPAKWMWRGLLLVACVFFIVHTATSARFFGSGYGAYLTGCWNAASKSAAGATGGGVLFGLIVYPIRAALSTAGAYVVFSLITAFALFLIVMATPVGARIKGGKRKGSRRKEEEAEAKSTSFDELEPNRTASFDERAERPAYNERSAQTQNFQENYAYAQPQDTAYARPQDTAYARPQDAYAQPRYADGTSFNANGAQPTDAQMSEYERSRNILFGGTTPADSYRDNLTFNSDSYYNQRSRENVRPQQQSGTSAQETLYSQTQQNRANETRQNTFGQTPVQGGAQPLNAGASYSEQWSAAAQAARPQMPRKVSSAEELNGGFSSEDISYPQTPSYRAEAKPAEVKPERDYYQNDVPYEEDFSSAPNVLFDEPTPPSEKEAEPVRKPAARRSAARSRAEKTTPAEPTEIPNNSDNIISGLFSRSTGSERTVIPDEVDNRFLDNARNGFLNRSQEPRTDRMEDFGRTREEATDFGRGRAENFESPREATDFGRGREGFGRSESDFGDRTRDFNRAEDSRVFDAPMDRTRSAADAFDDDEVDEAPAEPVVKRTETERRTPEICRQEPQAPQEQKRHVYSRYVAPTPDLLMDRNDTSTVSQEEIETNSATIVDTLGSYKIDAEVLRVVPGATVTRYDIQIPMNIPVNMVTKRSSELAMHLRAPRGVNVYANYEHGAISIEVPNAKAATVGMKSLVQSDEFLNTKPTSLTFAIGKNIDGRCVCGDINDMTHILVAGTTGSGKSICLHTLICSMLYKYSPEELRFILIDPKKNEFVPYEGMPHLMINEIICDAQKAVMAFNWAIKEMERRYTLFNEKSRQGMTCRKIDEYNAKLLEDEERLPKIVIVVDELADLMSVAKKDIEERIQRLAQKARAAGIHLVLATQRPSVDIVTGVIKSNLPTRFALHVQAEIDSRVILDESGAEKLLGHGDMIFTVGGAKRTRAQGAYLTPEETQAILDFVKLHNEAYFDDNVSEFLNKQPSEGGAGGADDDDAGEVDAQYIKALGMVVKLGTASISLIQRRCSVGYNHAGKIVEWMELMGYISPFDGTSKPRTVLLTQEEYESKYGKLE